MVNELKLAYKILDYMIQSDYGGSSADMEAEVGCLDDLVVKMVEIIEDEQLKESDGLNFLSFSIDQVLF